MLFCENNLIDSPPPLPPLYVLFCNLCVCVCVFCAGFCNPSILEHPVEPTLLYIKYSCSGQVYECTFTENESILLPSPSATEVKGAEYLCFRPWFRPPTELKGAQLDEWKREHPSYAYSERQIRVDRQRLALRMLREGWNGGSGEEKEENVSGVGWVRHGSEGETKDHSPAVGIVNLEIE